MKSKLDLTVEMLEVDPELSSKTLMRKLGVTRPYAYNLLSLARKKMREAVEELAEKVAGVAPPAPPVPTPDMVNHPAHYKTGGIETIDFIEAKKLNYHLGNVVKYITRADHKGDRLENLKKAQWYLEREIAQAS
jgi:hypothetical protein